MGLQGRLSFCRSEFDDLNRKKAVLLLCVLAKINTKK